MRSFIRLFICIVMIGFTMCAVPFAALLVWVLDDDEDPEAWRGSLRWAWNEFVTPWLDAMHTRSSRSVR